LPENSYHELSTNEQQRQYHDLRDSIDYFLRYVLGYPADLEIKICDIDLLDIIRRVDMRIHYFAVFHPKMQKINECKRSALLAYWFVKFRPIMITDLRFINKKEGYNTDVNEKFAIHYLLSALDDVGKIKHWDGKSGIKDLNFTHPYIKELIYSLRFRNFTIDSIIVLSDSITTETFTSLIINSLESAV
jgi:hypothetical protein